MVGVSIEDIYVKAKSLGTKVTHEEYNRKSDEAAIRVYSRCPISAGAGNLVDYLVTHDWQIALHSRPLHALD